jgi:hypothetical protein
VRVECLPVMNITPPPNEDERAHWRRCAEDARRTAEQVGDAISKQTLLDIAEAYEQLAALAAITVLPN